MLATKVHNPMGDDNPALKPAARLRPASNQAGVQARMIAEPACAWTRWVSVLADL